MNYIVVAFTLKGQDFKSEILPILEMIKEVNPEDTTLIHGFMTRELLKQKEFPLDVINALDELFPTQVPFNIELATDLSTMRREMLEFAWNNSAKVYIIGAIKDGVKDEAIGYLQANFKKIEFLPLLNQKPLYAEIINNYPDHGAEDRELDNLNGSKVNDLSPEFSMTVGPEWKEAVDKAKGTVGSGLAANAKVTQDPGLTKDDSINSGVVMNIHEHPNHPFSAPTEQTKSDALQNKPEPEPLLPGNDASLGKDVSASQNQPAEKSKADQLLDKAMGRDDKSTDPGAKSSTVDESVVTKAEEKKVAAAPEASGENKGKNLKADPHKNKADDKK